MKTMIRIPAVALGVIAAALAAGTGVAPAAQHRAASELSTITYIGTAEGGEVVSTDYDNHQHDPKYELIYHVDESYQGQLSFRVNVSSAGALTQVSGSGRYTKATVSVSGHNGDEGAFSCDPVDIHATSPFRVNASGSDSEHELDLNLSLEGASEINADQDCGAGFTAYAETSTNLAASLQAVMPAVFRHPGPLSVHLKKVTPSDDGYTKTVITDEWTVSVTAIDTAAPGGAGSGSGSSASGCTITGTSGDDTLHGTPGPDVICGLGGNDTVDGGGGADVIIAGPGNDVVDGGAGADTIYGGPGADRITGGAGKDFLYGNIGNDTLLARDGAADVVDGGPGRDTARADGKDKLRSIEARR